MSFDPLTAAFDLGKIAIEKIWPDPIRRAEEIFKLEELRSRGDVQQLNAHVQIMLAQIKVNEESAKHKSVFVAGSRPAVIWIGAISLAWSGVFHPILVWVWFFAGVAGDPPPMIDSSALNAIVAGLLGVSAYRSYDKTQGTQTDKLGGQQ